MNYRSFLYIFLHHLCALGCDCNYDLCASQRSGDYTKWKWFDMLLFSAIDTLSEVEVGSFTVYTGLKGVKLDSANVKSGYWNTYVSTSWDKKVALKFMGVEQGKKGMIIEIDKKYKNAIWGVPCCDVSWISKFPDEAEILFARSKGKHAFNNFNLTVVDESNGIQTVSLQDACEHDRYDDQY